MAPVAERPIKLVAMLPNPLDLAKKYNMAPMPSGDRDLIRNALSRLPGATVLWLESQTSLPPTLPNLERALSEGCHVLLFMGYNVPADAPTNAILLEGDDGNSVCLTTEQLAATLGAAPKKPELFVLTSFNCLPIGAKLLAAGLVARQRSAGTSWLTRRCAGSSLVYSRGCSITATSTWQRTNPAFLAGEPDWSSIAVIGRSPENRVLLPAGARPANQVSVRSRPHLLLRIRTDARGRVEVELSPPGRLALETEVASSDPGLFLRLAENPDTFGLEAGRGIFSPDSVGGPFAASLAAARDSGDRLPSVCGSTPRNSKTCLGSVSASRIAAGGRRWPPNSLSCFRDSFRGVHGNSSPRRQNDRSRLWQWPPVRLTWGGGTSRTSQLGSVAA